MVDVMRWLSGCKELFVLFPKKISIMRLLDKLSSPPVGWLWQQLRAGLSHLPCCAWLSGET